MTTPEADVELIHPFQIRIDEAELATLKRQLHDVRWPDQEPVSDWSQGVPLAKMQRLIAYWRDVYDWRRCENTLNGLGQHKTRIEGVDIHFLHIRSSNPGALPLLLSHGWPGSVIEFIKCIGPLTEPARHGGDSKDAFHVVIPSLPGFGFSGKPRNVGWSVEAIAGAWGVLMARLGYRSYVAQGGDWGAAITTAMAAQQPDGLRGIHLNLPLVLPASLPPDFSPEEAGMMESLATYNRWGAGYSTLQASRPQTIGYLLANSAVGQAAWIYEKYREWSDCDGEPENAFTMDEMLDNIMLYWITNSGASSARIYWESYHGAFGARRISMPVGCTIFPKDIYKAPRSWAEVCFDSLFYWNEAEKGGHFAAFEQPEVFVAELRKAFARLRGVGQPDIGAPEH